MFNIGIMGCGIIAKVMSDAIKACDDCRVAAIASKSIDRAKELVAECAPDATPYGSYEELTQDDSIDLIYIATPNVYHYENAIMCIKAHKNILLEKPFAMSKEETHSIFTEAKNRGVFVCEAMWTSFMPLHRQMLDWIEAGKIGDVKYISSNLGYQIEHRPRLIDPKLGGGSYLDLGVYPVNFALSILGEDLTATSVYAHKLSTGVERDVNFILENDEGAMATAFVTMSARTAADGEVVGDKGFIRIRNINNYEHIELYDTEGKLLERHDREGLSGYSLEVLSCKKAISEGLIQAPEMPWNKSMAIARINDMVRSMM